jgi:peptidylprolyl isomerase
MVSRRKSHLTYPRYYKMFRKICYSLLIVFGAITMVEAKSISDDNILIMELKYGTVKIEMYEDVAPNHVKRIKELVNSGFYDGIKFHRVIAGFMAQTGDPKGDGTGGSGQNLDAEFSKVRHERGILSMARAQNINSADSQFFIMLDDAPHLDGQYTVWGKVTSGMEYIDEIQKGDAYMNGTVGNPDKIISLKLASKS